jgi:protocatechuate 3,4-dioxygenase beta subunit
MHLALVLLLAATLDQAAPPAATGRISGRVTAEGTNAPISGARVMIFAMGRPTTPSAAPMMRLPQATTDQDGRFVFSTVAPGEYRIDVQKTGYASGFEPMTRPKTYAVAAGQPLDVSIVLQKGAVISGKVLDQKGDPLTDARVMALRRITPPGNSNMPPRLVPAPMQGPQQTNDIGEYRVTGLAPGEYFVAALPRSPGFGGPGMASAPGNGGGTPTASTTYYPGTVDQAGAQPITVAAGAEVSNIVFTIQSAPAYRVSGIVVDENGAPIAHAMVMLMADPRSGMMFLGPGGNAQTGDDGRFSIGDVSPGTYRLNASVPIMMPGSGGVSSGVVGGVSGGVVGGVSSFTSWSVTSNGNTTVTTTSNTPTPEPQQVVVGDADVRGVRVVTRRPPSPQ